MVDGSVCQSYRDEDGMNCQNTSYLDSFHPALGHSASTLAYQPRQMLSSQFKFVHAASHRPHGQYESKERLIAFLAFRFRQAFAIIFPKANLSKKTSRHNDSTIHGFQNYKLFIRSCGK